MCKLKAITFFSGFGKTLLGVLCMVSIHSCASNGNSLVQDEFSNSSSPQSVRQVELGRIVDQPLKLIANDMVDALTQALRSKPNPDVKVRVPTIDSKFDREVKLALASRGYEIVSVNTGDGTNVVRTSVTGKPIQTHILKLGGVSVKRSYSIINNKVTPRSSLFILGAKVNSIQLDDRKFLPNRFKHDDTFGALYLCTPEGKGLNTDGWVCQNAGDGKEWVDATTHAALIESGAPVRAIDWDELMAKPDVVILEPNNASVTGLEVGSIYLCVPKDKAADTDGWLCRVGGVGKQWIDANKRAELVRQGYPARRIEWASLMSMPNVVHLED